MRDLGEEGGKIPIFESLKAESLKYYLDAFTELKTRLNLVICATEWETYHMHRDKYDGISERIDLALKTVKEVGPEKISIDFVHFELDEQTGQVNLGEYLASLELEVKKLEDELYGKDEEVSDGGRMVISGTKVGSADGLIQGK